MARRLGWVARWARTTNPSGQERSEVWRCGICFRLSAPADYDLRCVICPGAGKKMNLAEICENAEKGREYAFLGNYDSSMVYHQGVIQQIHRHCRSL